jgi:predicted transcriptional regulator
MSVAHSDVTRADVLTELRETTDRFMTAAELADALDTDRHRINYRLKKLHDDGEVEKKRAGSRAVGWWAAEN